MSKVLLNVTIKNNEGVVNFETKGILSEKNNILIYNQDEVKNTLYIDKDILEREAKDSIIKLYFNKESINDSNIFLKGTDLAIKIELSVSNLEKTTNRYKVCYVVEDRERIEYEIKYKII